MAIIYIIMAMIWRMPNVLPASYLWPDANFALNLENAINAIKSTGLEMVFATIKMDI